MNQLFGTYDNFEFNSNNQLEISKDIFERELNEVFSIINHKYAIEYRDELIATYLKKMGIKSIFEIGPDNCSLLLKSKSLGLQVAGIDVSKKTINISKKYNLNVIDLSLEKLIEYKNLNEFLEKFNLKFGEDSVAISCLNILNGKWEDTNLKNRLIDFLFNNADEVIITCFENDLIEITKKYKIKSYMRLHHYKNVKVSQKYATLLQYGTMFNKKSKILEKIFSRLKNSIYISKLFSGYKYPEKIQTYSAITTIFKLK